VRDALARAGARLTAARAGRTLVVGIVAFYVAAGLVASHRAYFPVRSVVISASEDIVRPGTRIRVDTVTSGRGPVSIRVELLQAGRSEPLVVDSIPSKGWAYWDPRRVFHSTDATIPASVAERLEPGVITVRASVTGSPAWLRLPPPVVREVRLPFRQGREADRLE
jgi:hypothetical protein